MYWILRSLPSASFTFAFVFFLQMQGRWPQSGQGSFGQVQGVLPQTVTGRRRLLDADAGIAAALLAVLRLDRFAVPFRIVEVVVRLHEVVDREVVLAVVEPRAAPDDLLELDHRIDRAHQHDVAHVARIDAGRELLRRGQDGRDGLLVVLEVAQVLVAERAVVGRHALAVVRVAAGLHLVDRGRAPPARDPGWRRTPASSRAGRSAP